MSLTFKVQGKGTFPFDMLRYDCCYPADSQSASDLIVYDRDDRRRLRTITLRSQITVRPTEDRWRSFHWSVVKE
jgi:hypothetical protein